MRAGAGCAVMLAARVGYAAFGALAAAALATLAADAALRRRMGEAASARVLEGDTEAQVAAAAVALYRRIASPPDSPG